MKKNKYLVMLFIIVVLFMSGCGSSNGKKDDKDYLQIQRRKLLKTKGDIKAVGDAIMQFVIAKGDAPDIEKISDLSSLNFPYFSTIRNLKDAWGNYFLYLRDEDDSSIFYIASAGRDGKFEGWEQDGRYNIVYLKDYDRDIIYSNGGFVYISN